jgi:hypothetical protein
MEWHLWNHMPSDGQILPPEAVFRYGGAGSFPIVGDWDGDRRDSIGVVYLDRMEFHLRNSITAGNADVPRFGHGDPGRRPFPVAGKWSGRNSDGIGVVYLDTMEFLLRDTLSTGPVTTPPFFHGNPALHPFPVVGDWNGRGRDTIGIVYSEIMEWHLRTDNSTGPAQVSPFQYGASNAFPVVGRWTNRNFDAIGVVYSNGWWLLRNSTSGGPDDERFQSGYYTVSPSVRVAMGLSENCTTCFASAGAGAAAGAARGGGFQGAAIGGAMGALGNVGCYECVREVFHETRDRPQLDRERSVPAERCDPTRNCCERERANP